ncbi:hypothetical protein B0H63DRAFT_564240 [Podospora didyma]|uniref:Uncharacterized protein n=1 Tax=Podospora didyma TaxID=330526 RepID=A0AAE0N400_9PEZI|nr:hypothetical protein B0H63DRAFT_564240 [Podospora didyma]
MGPKYSPKHPRIDTELEPIYERSREATRTASEITQNLSDEESASKAEVGKTELRTSTVQPLIRSRFLSTPTSRKTILDRSAKQLAALYELGRIVKDELVPTASVLAENFELQHARELELILDKTATILDMLDTTIDNLSDDSVHHSLDEVVDDIAIYIDCLMDLSPALENPVIDFQPTNPPPKEKEAVDVCEVSPTVPTQDEEDRLDDSGSESEDQVDFSDTNDDGKTGFSHQSEEWDNSPKVLAIESCYELGLVYCGQGR